MPLPTGDTIGILADNLRLRRSVLPIPTESAIRWTRGLDLPRGGERVLYTGLMYQLIPYIEELVKAESRLAESWLSGFTGIGRQVNKLVNVSGFMAHPTREQLETYDRIPRNVALLLKRAGVEFGALYEDDLYSGALAYDLGADETLREHAQKVYTTLKKHGVKEVVTIDPHTTNMLRSVYPTLIDGYDLAVRNYLEVLSELEMVPSRQLEGDVAIHDSCVFARYEGVLREPRQLLEGLGLTLQEPLHAGTMTWCCGGPVESLFPEKAAEQAERRVTELQAVAERGVTMCPLCYVNLQKAANGRMRFDDISDYLIRGYEP
jgi:Fe-S oxidoreductase